MAITAEQYRQLRLQGFTREQVLSGNIPTQPRKRSALEKFGEFVGVEGIGESIGGGIARISPEGKRLAQLDPEFAKKGFGGVLGTGVSGKKLAGSVIQTGLTLGTGVGGIAKTLGGRALQFGLTGAGFGTGKALEENRSTKEIMERAFISGVISAPFPIITGFVSRGFQWSTQKLSERLYRQIFKAAEQDFRLQWQTLAKGQPLNPTLAREVIDRGLRGSSKNMALFSFKKLNELEQQVQNIVKNQNQLLILGNKKAYQNFLREVEKRFKNGFFKGHARTARTLLKELEQSPIKQISVSTTLKLRRFIDGMRNTSSFKLDPILSPRQEEFKLAANLLRKKIANVAGLGNLMNEERIYIQSLDAIISDAVQRQNRRLLNLTDIIIGGGGLATGGPFGGAIGIGAIRGFQQPFTLTNLGFLIDKLGNKVANLFQKGKTVVPLIAKEFPNFLDEVLPK